MSKKSKGKKSAPTLPAETTPAETTREPVSKRRSFLAVLVGGVVGVFPVLSGLAVFVSPLLRKKSEAGKWIRVASLDAVPADGKPHLFPVITDRDDAWSHYPPEPVGAVYLRRSEKAADPVAYSNVCPHLGCAVDYKPGSEQYHCPCHNSKFEIDGKRVDPENSPSPRAMDTVEVEIREGSGGTKEVWVDYKKFKGGVAHKVEE